MLSTGILRHGSRPLGLSDIVLIVASIGIVQDYHDHDSKFTYYRIPHVSNCACALRKHVCKHVHD